MSCRFLTVRVQFVRRYRAVMSPIDGADGGFLYPSGNTSLVMRASAKRPPLRIIGDALQQFATVDDLRQLACIGAALLEVVPQFLQGVELAGGVGLVAGVFCCRHVADQ